MFNGLNMNPGTLPLLSDAVSRSISAENITGEKGHGGMSVPSETGPARELGIGWKARPCLDIEPGEVRTIAEIKGSGAIQSIWMGGYVGRDLILRFYWDDQPQPSVECPQSDFFAYGWSTNAGNPFGAFSPLNSAMVCVNPNHALSCFWCMPFKKHCLVTAENRGSSVHHLFYQINYTLTEVPEDAGYFHAQFRQADPLPYKQDYVLLDGVNGKGHYVGTALSVGLNGAGRWWGEGEIKFFLDDDDKFPTICGTGTEDYFLGAYNWEVEKQYQTYSTPYAGMFRVNGHSDMYDSQMRFSLYRWHVTDPVRFEKKIRVTLQDLGWHKDGRFMPRQDTFASVSYWYQTLPTAPFPALPDRDALEL